MLATLQFYLLMSRVHMSYQISFSSKSLPTIFTFMLSIISMNNINVSFQSPHTIIRYFTKVTWISLFNFHFFFRQINFVYFLQMNHYTLVLKIPIVNLFLFTKVISQSNERIVTTSMAFYVYDMQKVNK